MNFIKREKAEVDGRRARIIEELKEHGRIRVDELAEKLCVSPLTIRRDLLLLEGKKKILRFYGGASLTNEEESAEDKIRVYRKLIAKHAASLVNEGDNIFINSSNTALSMLRYLGDKHVTVITNNGNVINMEVPPSVSVILVGGELRYPKYAIVGEIAVRNIENITAKKSFLGCSGLNIERGFTTENMNEVYINRMMFESVMDATYILADHTKLGKNSSFISLEARELKHIITDEKVPDEILQPFLSTGIDIYQVKRVI